MDSGSLRIDRLRDMLRLEPRRRARFAGKPLLSLWGRRVAMEHELERDLMFKRDVRRRDDDTHVSCAEDPLHAVLAC